LPRPRHHSDPDDEIVGFRDERAHLFAPGAGRPAEAAMAKTIGIALLAAAPSGIRTSEIGRGIPPPLDFGHDIPINRFRTSL